MCQAADFTSNFMVQVSGEEILELALREQFLGFLYHGRNHVLRGYAIAVTKSEERVTIANILPLPTGPYNLHILGITVLPGKEHHHAYGVVVVVVAGDIEVFDGGDLPEHFDVVVC